MKQVEAIEAVAYDASMVLTNWRLDANGQKFWARLYKTGPDLVQELREARKLAENEIARQLGEPVKLRIEQAPFCPRAEIQDRA